MKIFTVETEFQADGQTDRDNEAYSRFQEFCKTRLIPYISANLSKENPTHFGLGSNL